MKITLTLIKADELKELIAHSFSSDCLLREQYHLLAPAQLHEIVEHTYAAIISDSEHVSMYFFKVLWTCGGVSETIGYTVLVDGKSEIHNVLYSYCISSKYRLRFILQSWLAEVQRLLGQTFSVSLWNKNTRAINFFVKNGFEVREKREKHTILLIDKQLERCQ